MTSNPTNDTTSQGARRNALPDPAAIGKVIECLKAPKMGLTGMVESHRQDVDALVQASRDACDGIKAIASRRNALMKEELAQWTELYKDVTDPQVILRGVEIAQKRFERTVKGMRELIEMGWSVANETWKPLLVRFQDRLTKLQQSLQPEQAS